MSLRTPLRTRRGGGWDEAGWGRLRPPRPAVYTFLSTQGDASAPTPRNSAPAPTDTIHPFPQIPTRVSSAPPLQVCHSPPLKKPTPVNPFPAPRGAKLLPKRHHKYLTL